MDKLFVDKVKEPWELNKVSNNPLKNVVSLQVES
ncbi:MAG: hypothetical protein ACI9YH_000823 [Colwellia sp.]|jgi:hypothetical protein